MSIHVQMSGEVAQTIPVHHRAVEARHAGLNARTLFEKRRVMRMLVLLWLIASSQQAITLTR